MSRRRPHRSRQANRIQPGIAALEARLLLSADVLTFHNDNTRAGLNSSETVLTLADVNPTTFGKVGFDAVDGQVYAQPLYQAGVTVPGQGIHNLLYVATEHDSVYAFDADSGALLWQASMLGPGEVPSDTRGTPDTISVENGISATPVIDPATGTIYIQAMSKLVAGGQTTYIQRLHALDITTGLDKVAPAAIDSRIYYPGVGPGSDGTNIHFDPSQHRDRAALTLANGVIYTAWSSFDDQAPYTGWIIAFDARTLGVVSVLNTDPYGSPSAAGPPLTSGNSFWNSGDGFAADAAGNIYNTTANGPFDPSLGDLGDSFLKLYTPNGLTLTGRYTPANQQFLSDNDLDLDTGGVILLPPVTDAAGQAHPLAVVTGKDADLTLVDVNNPGGAGAFGSAPYQRIPAGVGQAAFGTPAYFNGQIYVGGPGGNLRAFRFFNGLLDPIAYSISDNTFGFPAASPSVSANGTADGIVWAVNRVPNSPSILEAYDAANLHNLLYNSDQAWAGRDLFGTANKFVTPTIANGRVYVATTKGVAVFGLLGPATQLAPLAVGNPVAPATSVIVGTVGVDPFYPESALTYTWSTLSAPAGAPAPTFGTNGTHNSNAVGVNFGAAGSYNFRVTISDPSGRYSTSDLNVVVVQFPSQLAVAPAALGLADGASAQFTATGLDQFGAPLGALAAVNWTVAPGGAGGQISASGLYTAPGATAGHDTVVASGNGLSGSATVALSPFTTHIKFTSPATPGQAPPGFLTDTGQAFGPKAGGLTFGWNVDNSPNMIERVGAPADALHSGFALLQAASNSNASWSIAVPNGVYRVHLLAGDPASTGTRERLQVNGVTALAGVTRPAGRYLDGTVTVTVTGGRLTVSNGPRSGGNKLNAIDVTQLSVLPTPRVAAPHPQPRPGPVLFRRPFTAHGRPRH